MKLSKITIFKNFFSLIILSIFITSCEPEEMPIDKQNETKPTQIYSDTGDQKNSPETKP